MIDPSSSASDSRWCTFVRERLELFLDGELQGSENLAFVTHLRECDECASYWAGDELSGRGLMLGVGNVGAGSSEVSPSGSATSPQNVLRPRRNGPRLVVAAAAIAVAGAAAFLGWSFVPRKTNDAALASGT